jgi:muramoyltetrapeptide carboxypeptidase LdcA involved in peptidoglycan recycling
MEYVKPGRLKQGDTVAVLSPSWGGPSVFPHVFETGLRVMQDVFGLLIREMPCTRMSPEDLAANPQLRADSLTAAFVDPNVTAIIATIGGDESGRILRYLDPEIMRQNPKIFMGYSDICTQLLFAHNAGLVTFNGPAVMAGFAQLRNFPECVSHVRSILFEPTNTYTYQPFSQWSNKYADWNSPDYNGEVEAVRAHDGWHWVNGSGVANGRLYGGCAEVLEFLKGSSHWPGADFWKDRILYLETSEEKPTIDQVRHWLFNYGMQGIFDDLSALLIGRARDFSNEEKQALDEMIRFVVVEQFGATNLPIVTNLDFGHTDPQWIMPNGIRAEVDVETKSLRLLEPAVL